MVRIMCLIRNGILKNCITYLFIVVEYQAVTIFGGLCAVAENPLTFVLLQFVIRKIILKSLNARALWFLVTTDCKKKK